MITETNDRANFIGGSEANMIYQNYQSQTFKKWWAEKLTGVHPDSFNNLSMAVGTILEHDVIDLYERLHGVKGLRDQQGIKGIARANTDLEFENKVNDVKVTKHAFEWFIKDWVPIQYRRQLIHYRYVREKEFTSIIAYQTTEELMQDPFQPLNPHLLYEIPIEITDKEIEEHREKIEYLEWCRDNNLYPGEE